MLVVCRRRGDRKYRGVGYRHGYSEEQHERIFEEFYQLNNPARDRKRGLGLGLATVRRVTQLLNHP